MQRRFDPRSTGIISKKRADLERKNSLEIRHNKKKKVYDKIEIENDNACEETFIFFKIHHKFGSIKI